MCGSCVTITRLAAAAPRRCRSSLRRAPGHSPTRSRCRRRLDHQALEASWSPTRTSRAHGRPTVGAAKNPSVARHRMEPSSRAARRMHVICRLMGRQFSSQTIAAGPRDCTCRRPHDTIAKRPTATEASDDSCDFDLRSARHRGAGARRHGRREHGRLAAAVSNAGLGILGAAACQPDDLRKWIAETRRLTDKPFGVDTLLPASVRREGGPRQGPVAARAAAGLRPSRASSC
jgi:hypothetical protein